MPTSQESDLKLIMLALAEVLERITELQNQKILESMMDEKARGVFAPTSMTALELRKRARGHGPS
ncbi:MAG TPA: hypothetical protein PLM09_06835 [Casimicrobiaceae bacterium]|nr:hypothetical protein [Casimicrobiaceae bacterium]